MSIPTIPAVVVAAVLTLGWLRAAAQRRRLRAEAYRLRWMVEHDPLTGLPNRHLIQSILVDLAGGDPVGALAIVDLDGFKATNDTHGHHVGDALLVAVARRLDTAAHRHGAIAARLGGDEFLILLPGERGGTSADWVAAIDAIHAALDEPLDVGQTQIPVSASVGVSALGGLERETDPMAALREADVALYWAKTTRVGSRVVHHPGMTMPPAPGSPGRRRRER